MRNVKKLLDQLFRLDDQNMTQRMFKGSLFVAVFTISAAPIGYLIRMVLSRSLSIEMYGLFYAALAFIGLFTSYNDLGFGYSLTYLIPKFMKKKAYQSVWCAYIYERNIELISAVSISIVLLCLSPWLAVHYFKVNQATWLLNILCLYFIGNCYISAIHKYFMGLRQEPIHVSIQPFLLLSTLLGTTFFILIGRANIYSFAVSWSFAYLLGSVFYTVVNRRKNAILVRQKVIWQKPLFLKMAGYALPSILNSSIFTIITSMDIFFLTLFHGVSEVGVYNIILPIAAIPTIFFSPLESFLFPYISHFAEGEKNKIETLLYFTQAAVVVTSIYFGIFIALFPSFIITTLFGAQWQGVADQPLRIWAFSFVIFGLTSHINMMISGVGKIKERLRASVGIAVFNFVVSGTAIYFFGIMGAVVSNILVNLISLITYAFILRQEIKLEPRLDIFAKALLLGAGLFFGIDSLHLRPQGWLQLFEYGIGYTILFACLVIAFGFLPIHRKTLQVLRHVLSKST